MPIDHCHEQINREVKGSVGAVGLFDSENSLRQRMLAGPERSRLNEEFFQEYQQDNSTGGDRRHHEESPAFQETCLNHATNVYNTIDATGKPFTLDCLN